MLRPVAVALALAALATACGTSDAGEPASAPSAAELGLPTQLLGLRLVQEDITEQLDDLEDSYFDAMALYGYRANDADQTLRATLQVGRFNDLARPDDPRFLARITSNVGASVPEEMRVGEHPVYLSIGQLQYTFLWFAHDWMYVLNVRRDYDFGRTMLRTLVEGSLV